MKIPAHIQRAIQAYYAERATPDDVAALEAWFREDDGHIKVFAEHGLIDWQILCEQEKNDATAILTILREAEENAEPDFSLLNVSSLNTVKQSDEELITFRKLCSLTGYVAAKGLRTKAGVIGSLAAIFLLGAALTLSLLSFGGSPDPQGDPQEVAGGPPAGPVIETAAVVATLTDERGAVWDRRPGQDLYAGQHFTLTEGIAEVTTVDGAVAILQAPATFELISNSNTLRLHSGKLVGVCETESSKGFLVRTPHMDITDLGTRFGVDVSETDTTKVHVYQGAVQASNLADGPQATEADLRLTSGQAAQATASDPSIQRITYDTTRLAKIGPTIKPLAGTGLGLSPGEVDPNWQIVAIDGKPLGTPLPLRVNKLQAHYAELYPNDPATSQWASCLPPRPKDNSQIPENAAYHFQTQIELPETFDPSTGQIVARVMADDQIQGIFINGQAIPVPYQKAQDDPDAWFKEVYEIVLNDELMPGQNTIEIVVLNKFTFQDYVGLRVAWELQTNSQGLNNNAE